MKTNNPKEEEWQKIINSARINLWVMTMIYLLGQLSEKEWVGNKKKASYHEKNRTIN